MSLTEAQLNAYRETLDAERSRVLESIQSLAADMVTSGISDPEGDVPSEAGAAATAVETRGRTSTLARHEARLLGEIEEALGRIERGSYGACTVCGAPIPTARLDALPWADRCIDHAMR